MPEHSLFEREVSADGMVRVNPGETVGLNQGMGVVEDGREKQPVSLAAPTVSTSSELFLTETDGGPGSDAVENGTGAGAKSKRK